MSRAITLPDENLPKKNASALYSKKEKEDLQLRVTDLEKSLQINKEIISSLIDSSTVDDKYRKIMQKINSSALGCARKPLNINHC